VWHGAVSQWLFSKDFRQFNESRDKTFQSRAIAMNAAKSPSFSAPDATVDISAEVCPMTFVRTRLVLDRLKPGQTLLVSLRGDEPLRNVPRTAQEQGHEVLSLETAPDGITRILLRRGP
jgi:TusA-related sulfurtransferase